MTFYSPPHTLVEAIRERCASTTIESPERLMDCVDAAYRSSLREGLSHTNPCLHRARAQQQLFRFFLRRVKALKAGHLSGHGLAGATIAGPKGIGKSSAAQAFVNVIESVHQDVIGVYVDMKALSGTVMESDAFLAGLKAHLLEARNLIVPPSNKLERREKRLVDALKAVSKFVFLFVDELDEFYRNDPTPANIGTLQELAVLGETGEGRITTVLCGSSAYLDDLIQCQTTRAIQMRFRLTTGGIPDLNGSKFPTTRIYANTPVDLASVAAIFQAEFPSVHVNLDDAEMLGKVREIAFKGGATVDVVQQLLPFTIPTGTEHPNNAILRDETSHTYLGLNSVEKSLYDGFIKATARKNWGLFKRLLQDENIRTVNWEATFQPLTWSVE